MIIFKQSTASQEAAFGPFVDETDGKTAETGLTIANTDIKIHVAGATVLANKNSGGGTHISGGIYYAVFDATDTATLGSGRIFIHVSGALPVSVPFVVLAANIYDSLVGGGDVLDVSVTQWLGTAAATPTVAGVPEVDITHYRGTASPAEHTAGYPIVTIKDGTGTGEIDTTAGAVSAVATVAGTVLQQTTIATLASQTSFTLTAGSADDNAYNGCVIVVQDASTAAQKAVGVIADYTGATKTITLLNDPAIFTMAVGDTVYILPDRSLKPTVDNRTADLDATGGVEVGTVVAVAATTIADAILNRDMSAVSDTNSRSPLNALRFLRNKWSISAGTLTVEKEDDATDAWTAAVTTTAGNPTSAVDPT